ncbi:MAG: hypothetical protein L5657_00860 [Calditerricola sp.]|nr:hypothetical protein [Calditerricola sp.]
MDVRDISWHHKDDSEPPAARAPQKGAPLGTQQPRTVDLPVDRIFLADRDAGLMEDPHLLAHVPFDDAGSRLPTE